MSRLDVKTPSKSQAIADQLYRNMEQRIAASPPGLCPVDMALNFLNLCQAQTCGKCVPCRIGLAQLSNMIREVLDGEPDIRGGYYFGFARRITYDLYGDPVDLDTVMSGNRRRRFFGRRR